MADPFAFETDVAPLRGSYFSTVGASGRQRTATEQRALTRQYERDVRPVLDRSLGTALAAQRLQQGDQNIEANRLQLQEQRRQMREQREFADKLPESMSALTGILSAEADPDLKEQGLAEFAVKNPRFMANPAGADLFRSVISGISSQRNQREAALRAEQEAKQNMDRLAFGLAETGNVKALKRLNRDTGGVYSPLEPVAKEVNKSGVARAKQISAAKQIEEQRAEEAKIAAEQRAAEGYSRKAEADLFEKMAESLAPKEGEYFGEASPPPKLSDLDVDYLRARVPFLDRTITAEQAADMDPIDLLKRARIVSKASPRSPITIKSW